MMKWCRPGTLLLGVGVLAMGILPVMSGLFAQERPLPPVMRRPAGDDFPNAAEVLQGYEASSGFFTVHRKKNSVLLEVPAYQLGRVFLMAMSFSGGTSY